MVVLYITKVRIRATVVTKSPYLTNLSWKTHGVVFPVTVQYLLKTNYIVATLKKTQHPSKYFQNVGEYIPCIVLTV